MSGAACAGSSPSPEPDPVITTSADDEHRRTDDRVQRRGQRASGGAGEQVAGSVRRMGSVATGRGQRRSAPRWLDRRCRPLGRPRANRSAARSADGVGSGRSSVTGGGLESGRCRSHRGGDGDEPVADLGSSRPPRRIRVEAGGEQSVELGRRLGRPSLRLRGRCSSLVREHRRELVHVGRRRRRAAAHHLGRDVLDRAHAGARWVTFRPVQRGRRQGRRRRTRRRRPARCALAVPRGARRGRAARRGPPRCVRRRRSAPVPTEPIRGG